MRKTLKFLHTLATIGFVGALTALIVLHLSLPEPTELQRFAAVRIAMGAMAEWILLPSMGLVLVSGLLSMAVTPAFQEAPELGATLGPEWGSFWVLLLVGVANVVLGIWRPRFKRQ